MREKLELAKIEFKVAPFAVEFLKDYLKFLGLDKTVENVALEAFWDHICTIRDELHGLMHYDHDKFFKKYPNLSLVESREEQKRQSEMERQSDC